MNAIHSELVPAPDNSSILIFETELTSEVRFERYRLDARRAFKQFLLLAIAVGCLAVTFLAELLGGFVAAWNSGLDLSVAGAKLWAPIPLGLFCFFLARSHALSAGSVWAVWRGRAPVVLSAAEHSSGKTRYIVKKDYVEAVEIDQTEAWHFAHVSKPLRVGRFVIWKRANYGLFFLPLPSEEDARRLVEKVKKKRAAKNSKGFDPRNAPAAANYQEISATAVFHALEGLSKKLGTPCPAWLDSVFNYLAYAWISGLSIFLFFVLLTGKSLDAGFPLFNQIGVILLFIAMTTAAVNDWPYLPKLRHLHYYRHGLLRGFDWGPTAVSCDKTAVEIWREGKRLRLNWSAVRSVHNENDLTIIETKDDRLHVVPEIPAAANLLSAYRVSQGLGLWTDTKRSAAPKIEKKRWWQSTFVNIAIWVIVFLVILGLFNLAGAKPASTELLRDENLPEWYEEVSQQDRVAAVNTDAPVNLPIHDEKIRLEDNEYQRVRQSFFAVHDRSTLELYGEVQLMVDPNFERATLHRLQIHRDGKVLDQLDLPFEELRREPELNSGVMLGDIEYFGQIVDLRVGDTVEMIWSTTATTPVFPDQFHYRSDGLRDWGWEQRRTSIDLPTAMRFELNHTDEFDVQREEAAGRTILSWSLEKAEADDRNTRSADDWDVSNDGLQLSTFQDWFQIIQRLTSDYKPRPDLLPGDLIKLLDEMLEQSEDPQWRATQALRLVQDRVRYFSVSIGEGGWIPRSPNEVWLSAYGDCKDKALLLISMLAYLQIEADVVLVDHDMGPALPRMLPSPFIFDHAIVRVRDPQGDWFVDATDLLQGGVGREIPLRDFAWGLPLAEDSTGLVEVVTNLSDEPTREAVQEYVFLDEGPIAAVLNVTDTWQGVEADNMRWRYDGEDMEDRRKQYEKWYAKRFPGATHSEALIIEDDLDANVFSLVQRYTLPRDGFEEKDLWNKLNHSGYAISGELYEFDDDEVLEGQSRVNAPMHNVHRVVMRNVPAPIKKPNALEFENDFIQFNTGGEWNEVDATWTYQWSLKTKQTTLKPGDEDAWREGEDYVDNNDGYYVYLHRRLFEAVENKPIYMGLNATQLMIFPVFLLVAMLMLLFFRQGIRAEVLAAKAKQEEDEGCAP
ncbi:DUF3857 domain-containing transglutaminase family protein [Ruegeria halocynthiae]|uniref:DUF3857 domain-containing transglutaminase family protein n=1 Tax=Ruegeria halocynthiae TaxID=985054 RepID=UPI00055EFA09|nr:DUF3857 domain-containing protein [Ruegeria halocynthiae]